MANDHYDIIVIGVGSMGAAACYYLARQGIKVCGLEQFTIPHEQGSHGGQTRIIRKAYYEHPDYVPLLSRAYSNWEALEKLSSQQLYFKTGLLYAAPRHHPIINGVKKAATLHNIPLDEYKLPSARKKFPAFNFEKNDQVVFEKDAGFLLPGKAIEAYAKAATDLGVTIMTNERTLQWEIKDNSIEVTTENRKYSADKLIITGGAWSGNLMRQMSVPLKITRQLLIWTMPEKPEDFNPKTFPCWMIANDSHGVFYGFPYLENKLVGEPSGLKFALHYPGDITDPGNVNRSITDTEIASVVKDLKQHLPVVTGKIVAAKTCLYANSPDEDFIIDHLPGTDGKVSFACGFSGHGFKFASVIGEILADLALKGHSDMPIEFLRLKRFVAMKD